MCSQNLQTHFVGGQRWIRTIVLRREQIYSLPPLATRPPAHIFILVLKVRLELTRSIRTRDFKSRASAYSATRAYSYWVGLWPSHLGTHPNWCSTVGLLIETPKCYPTTRLWNGCCLQRRASFIPKGMWKNLLTHLQIFFCWCFWQDLNLHAYGTSS